MHRKGEGLSDCFHQISILLILVKNLGSLKALHSRGAVVIQVKFPLTCSVVSVDFVETKW